MDASLDPEIAKRMRNDISFGIDAWKLTLEEAFGDKLVAAYAKGSAIKPLKTKLDYVPFISDLDIHIKVEGDPFERNIDGFEKSLEVGELYENNFYEINPSYFHIPRPQVMLMRQMEVTEMYVPPKQEEVKIICGKPNFNEKKISKSKIREWDRIRLVEEENWLNKFYLTVFDRAELDYWSALRRLVYRVSPAPIRLLTQTEENPLDLWSMNRTRIHKKLTSKYPKIADYYANYYLSGWDLFESGFSSSQIYRNTLYYGFSTVKECINQLD